MKVFKPDENSFIIVEIDSKKKKALKGEVFNQFNPLILGLGDIKQPSIATNAICVVYDLGGFTNFCKQIDPQLSVPSFLGGFLDWIFDAIKSTAVIEKFEVGVRLYHSLPFYTKFLGDGLLILWDTADMNQIAQHNLILTQYKICSRYISEFYPEMKKKVCDPPDVLRCGITKGTIYSVGDCNDFVGPCINLSARLQKLPGASFAFARRGFDPESAWKKAVDRWILKKVAIRGMGNEELIYLRRDNYEQMNEADKEFYHDP